MSDTLPSVPVTAKLWRIVRLFVGAILLLISKLARIIYVLLMSLLVLLGWLLFTTSGAQWLSDRAMQEESRLTLTVSGGSLWNGLEVSGLHWMDAGVTVFMDEAEIRWNHLCLLQMRVCLGLLHADSIRVVVDSAAMAADVEPDRQDDAALADVFPLPITAVFPDIRLREVDLYIDGTHVHWNELAISGALGRQSLRLASVSLQGLAVTLAEEEGSDDNATPAAEALDETAAVDIAELLNPANRAVIELPEISLPLGIYLELLSLRDVTVTQGQDVHRISSLDLSADMVGSDVVVRRFNIEHTQLVASMDGRIRLAADYPLDLSLQAEIRDALEGESLKLEAMLWNSVADMELRVRSDGPGQLAMEGTVRPLQPALPMNLAVDWSHLGWPLPDRSLVASDQGRLRMTGDLHNFTVDADLDIRGADIPPGQWALAGSGDYTGLSLERLQGQVLDGTLLLAGTLGWAEGLRWDLQLNAAGINASVLANEAPDDIHADITSKGGLIGEALTLDVDVARLRALTRGQPLVASGQVSHRPARGWRSAGIRVEAGESHVHVAGSVHDRIDLEGSLELSALSMFYPGLDGAVSGTFAARGTLESPDVTLDLRASSLAWEDQLELASLHLEASIVDLAQGNSRLRLDLDGLVLPRQEVTVEAVRLAADGARADHRLTLDVEGAPAELSLAVSGALDPFFAWRGAIDRAAIAGAGMGWELEGGSVPATWDSDTQLARLGAHCWSYRGARLCAEQELVLGASGQASVNLQGYELAWLSGWLPEDVELLGAIVADVSAQWGNTPLPLIAARVAVEEGAVRVPVFSDEEELETLDLAYQTLALSLTVDENQLRTRLDLVSGDLGSARVDATLDVGADGALGDLDGTIEVRDLQLAVAQPFFAEMRTLEGVVSAEGSLSGAAQDPRFDGTLLLADGRVETLALPVALSDIRLELEVAGDQATLVGGFRSGVGEAGITGDADWSDIDDWRARIQLTGERLEFAYDTIATVRASPDLEVRLRPGEVALGGRIVIPRADITISDLPESAVRTSGDVVIIDEQLDQEEGVIAAGEVPTALGWSVSTEIEIVLGNRVELTGFGVTGRLAGELLIRQVGEAAPQALGEIRIEDGRYRAYGQRLVIREGQFLFSGPVDQPEIYIEAVRLVPRYDTVAGLRVEGRPDEPRVSLFSEPSLPDEDVLALLILGRPLGESGPEGGNLVAQAALALGIAGGGGIATAIAEDIGIDEFAVDTEGEGGETQFVVSGYLGPNLYLSYGVGVFAPENTLTIRYRLANNLFLQAVRSLENAVDLLYTFEF